MLIPCSNAFLEASIWLLRLRSFKKGDLLESIAAMLTAASTHLKKAPYRMSLPRNTSSGNLANCFPSGVNVSVPVRAFTVFNDLIARRIFFEDGGSIASDSVPSISPRLHIFTRRIRSWSDRRSISGVCCSESYLYFKLVTGILKL